MSRLSHIQVSRQGLKEMGYRMVIYKGVWILKITSDILLLKHSLLKPEDLKFGSSLPELLIGFFNFHFIILFIIVCKSRDGPYLGPQCWQQSRDGDAWSTLAG